MNKLLAFAMCATCLSGCAHQASSSVQAIAATKARMDPEHPYRMPASYYSDQSRRNHEEGTCIVKLTIGVHGRVRDERLIQSSGHKSLDDACVDFLGTIQMLPATENGKPIVSTVDMPIAFKLDN